MKLNRSEWLQDVDYCLELVKTVDVYGNLDNNDSSDRKVEGQKQSKSRLLVSNVLGSAASAARQKVSQKNSWKHAPLPRLSLVSQPAPRPSLVKRFGLVGDWR